MTLNWYALFATPQVGIIAILLVADVVLGIIAALVRKEFNLNRVADFMEKGVLPYVFGFVVVEALGVVMPQYTMVVQLVFVLVVIKLLASIFANLAELGVKNIPAVLKKR